jgi:hypothetical protein
VAAATNLRRVSAFTGENRVVILSQKQEFPSLCWFVVHGEPDSGV